MTRRYAIRLDIDTTVCARRLAEVVALGDSLGVRFTIFANMGRSVSVPAALRRRLTRGALHTASASAPAKLSIRSKIGWLGLFESILLNPELQRLSGPALRQAQERGHEIGLHGGLNHSLWHYAASTMSTAQMHSFLVPAIERYQQLLGAEGFGFSSPGFAVSEPAYELLAEAGCRYLSDFIDMRGVILRRQCGLPDIPVTLAAANTVDYLEWLVASGGRRSMEDAVAQSIGESGFGVYYSHPCFIAGRGKGAFIAFVQALKEQASIVTMQELLS
ncbi:polysaccharide deacetylase family protein [Pseudomonas sp. PDM18]|uniref:polysaccharide deacetylase family protein n=1 Tax=Pseudomonas sp. PDM18 TaxID=2769253 RepID=UPI00178294BD|nr:polysaccharide deacetylase family protein [Pseudomonas sp. PDM18]MBD9676853.1 polysaccharide deacetylase family protein [Pseudomonas sp. PDM18]